MRPKRPIVALVVVIALALVLRFARGRCECDGDVVQLHVRKVSRWENLDDRSGPVHEGDLDVVDVTRPAALALAFARAPGDVGDHTGCPSALLHKHSPMMCVLGVRCVLESTR